MILCLLIEDNLKFRIYQTIGSGSIFFMFISIKKLKFIVVFAVVTIKRYDKKKQT